ncbi:hypothetical protein SDC9_04152 [bioreactor metagenome]|uniref:Uncharacterized protein n=1 Tax=bioreactor metagenome TaxID=1076179 RepID=A0A644SV86_9ZZZZ|nr:anaerobic ribonucleoside-triphosphate reductase [Negativicutes bacterium]
MQTIIDNITVIYDDAIAMDELREYVKQEQAIWDGNGKPLASIDVKLCGDDVEITSHERSPITRLRRITGYLSTVDRFNDAKQAELKARQVHVR